MFVQFELIGKSGCDSQFLLLKVRITQQIIAPWISNPAKTTNVFNLLSQARQSAIFTQCQVHQPAIVSQSAQDLNI